MHPAGPAPVPVVADARWAAIAARDPAADGAFVYSVRTTGIYCRPTCPARLAQRRNVAFHATPADAEVAGFRPCLRCRPDLPPRAIREAALIAGACRAIDAAESTPGLGLLAEMVGLSTFHFHRLFKAHVGLTPRAYAAARRAERARETLANDPATITDGVYDAGFTTASRFYEASNAMLGMTPTSFRRGGAGETITFAIGQCSLGAILVAATAKGICAILIGDDPDALARDMQDRFPHADLVGGDPAFEDRVARVVGFVEAPALGLDLPLDIRGTAFQQRVWDALRAIPPGETVSYATLAGRLGVPSGHRAVAGACAANALAVAIPCHRVVRSDGGLSGYRWGVARKQMLLDREKSAGHNHT
jgi:AraC family transcriptional regulator of adaptative response/methylated-DNA-[protein]-cysteine methyltransferase